MFENLFKSAEQSDREISKAEKASQKRYDELFARLQELREGSLTQRSLLAHGVDIGGLSAAEIERLEKALRQRDFAEMLINSEMTASLDVSLTERFLHDRKFEKLSSEATILEKNTKSLNKSGFISYLFRRTFSLADDYSYDFFVDDQNQLQFEIRDKQGNIVGLDTFYDKDGNPIPPNTLKEGNQLVDPTNPNGILKIDMSENGDRFAQDIDEFLTIARKWADKSPREIRADYIKERLKRLEAKKKLVSAEEYSRLKANIEGSNSNLEKYDLSEAYRETARYRDFEKKVADIQYETDAKLYQLYSNTAAGYQQTIESIAYESFKEDFVYAFDASKRKATLEAFVEGLDKDTADAIKGSKEYAVFLELASETKYDEASLSQAKEDREKAFEKLLANASFGSAFNQKAQEVFEMQEAEAVPERFRDYSAIRREAVAGLPTSTNAIIGETTADLQASYAAVVDKQKAIAGKYIEPYMAALHLTELDGMRLPALRENNTYLIYDIEKGFREVGFEEARSYFFVAESPIATGKLEDFLENNRNYQENDELAAEPNELNIAENLSEAEFRNAIKEGRLVPEQIYEAKARYDKFVSQVVTLEYAREKAVKELDSDIKKALKEGKDASIPLGQDLFLVAQEGENGLTWLIQDGVAKEGEEPEYTSIFTTAELEAFAKMDSKRQVACLAAKTEGFKLNPLNSYSFDSDGVLLKENGEPALSKEDAEKVKARIAKEKLVHKSEYLAKVVEEAEKAKQAVVSENEEQAKKSESKGSEKGSDGTAKKDDKASEKESEEKSSKDSPEEEKKSEEKSGESEGKKEGIAVAGQPQTKPYKVGDVNVAGIIKFLQVKQCMSYDLIIESAERLAERYTKLAKASSKSKGASKGGKDANAHIKGEDTPVIDNDGKDGNDKTADDDHVTGDDGKDGDEKGLDDGKDSEGLEHEGEEKGDSSDGGDGGSDLDEEAAKKAEKAKKEAEEVKDAAGEEDEFAFNPMEDSGYETHRFDVGEMPPQMQIDEEKKAKEKAEAEEVKDAVGEEDEFAFNPMEDGGYETHRFDVGEMPPQMQIDEEKKAKEKAEADHTAGLTEEERLEYEKALKEREGFKATAEDLESINAEIDALEQSKSDYNATFDLYAEEKEALETAEKKSGGLKYHYGQKISQIIAVHPAREEIVKKIIDMDLKARQNTAEAEITPVENLEEIDWGQFTDEQIADITKSVDMEAVDEKDKEVLFEITETMGKTADEREALEAKVEKREGELKSLEEQQADLQARLMEELNNIGVEVDTQTASPNEMRSALDRVNAAMSPATSTFEDAAKKAAGNDGPDAGNDGPDIDFV